jgi:hypothetical protein
VRTLKVTLLALSVLLMALGSTATAVNAAPKNSPFQCAGMTMKMGSQTQVTLVKLELYVDGKPMTDTALTVAWWKGNWHHTVGYAHPGCWTALPVKPSWLHYHDGRHPSVLCISTHNGNQPYNPDPRQIRGCPWPVKVKYRGVTWTTIVFRVIAPHNGG